MDKRTILFVIALSLTLFGVNFLFHYQNMEKKQAWQEQQKNKPSVPKRIEEKIEKLSSPTGIQQTSSDKQGEEKFYVLETPYQQLVFSNYGGALAEINLNFRTKENELSVVREIDFDRKMAENYPYNAFFPAHAYYTSGTGSDLEFHEKGKLSGYYPLLRRDLIEKLPRKNVDVKPPYYALNIVSNYPEVANSVYQVTHFDNRSITFKSDQGIRRISKTYTIEDIDQEVPYCLNLSIEIEGDSRGLWLTTGVPEVEWISGGPAPALKYRITRNKKAEVEKIDLPTDTLTMSSVYLDWICNSNGFLGMILNPLQQIEPGYQVQYVSGTAVPSRLVEIDQAYNRFPADKMPGYMAMLPLPHQSGTTKYSFFAGPFDDDILKQVDAKFSDPATGYNPDYIACQTMHGWFTFISEPFAKFLLILMNFFHFLTNSWALSIVLLTISLRLMLYPLNTWSTKSMVRMQQIAPEVTAIQEKHKKDPKKAQLEIMNLYRERGVNPVSGCLPLLIQMPFLIGMFDLLKSSFALRGAPFIPGWIDDLTAPDVLFSWSRPLFFIGTEFHLLPILLGLVMFFQQRLMSTAPKDPNQMTDQQRQQKAMGSIMTVVFAVMFYNFPSGLNIYWLSSMLLGMLQQWYTTKKVQQEPIPAPKMEPKKAKARG
jgi:YidC/Oxa1 family membrane protein insertase